MDIYNNMLTESMEMDIIITQQNATGITGILSQYIEIILC